MTPFSQYKGWVAEGGIRNALVVSGPGVKRAKGSINHGVMHVADLMPTLLETAGTGYPKALDGRELPPLIGKSWNPVLAARPRPSGRSRTSSPGKFSATVRCGRGLEAPLAIQAVRQGRLGALQRRGGPGRAQGSRRREARQAEGPACALGRLRQGKQRDPASRSMFETLDDTLPKRVPDDAATRRSSTSVSSCRREHARGSEALSLADPQINREG